LGFVWGVFAVCFVGVCELFLVVFGFGCWWAWWRRRLGAGASLENKQQAKRAKHNTRSKPKQTRHNTTQRPNAKQSKQRENAPVFSSTSATAPPMTISASSIAVFMSIV
jgi:hypothetical protein